MKNRNAIFFLSLQHKNVKAMQTYKFNTCVSKDGAITLPFAPELFNREVEVTIVPKHSPSAASAPDGYMTLEEFRVTAKASLTKILKAKQPQ
jgi:hypothetical protein